MTKKQLRPENSGSKRDGILRDGRDRTAKLFFLRDGTGIFGTAGVPLSGTGKNGTERDPAIFLILKLLSTSNFRFEFYRNSKSKLENRN